MFSAFFRKGGQNGSIFVALGILSPCFSMLTHIWDGETTAEKQVNIKQHNEQHFSEIVKDGLVSGGIHVNASKNHGKSRLLFSMAQHLRSLDNCRVIAFDGSEAWLYGFSMIPTFDISEHDIQLVNDVKSTDEIERYTLNNWCLVKLALETHKDLLFRLKTRKPSKRGYFIRTIINYIDNLQRTEREVNPNNEPKTSFAFFIEESQDCLNSRATTRLEAEEFLTVFNEARNQKEAFFTASQRLTDFSKTIRTKQHYCLGKINIEDKVSGIKPIEKEYNIDFSKMPQRTWFYDGSTFESPTWKQSGKPFIINQAIRQRWFNSMPKTEPEKPKSQVAKFFELIFPMMTLRNPKERQNRTIESQPKDDTSEYDQILTLPEEDSLLPPETEEF